MVLVVLGGLRSFHVLVTTRQLNDRSFTTIRGARNEIEMYNLL